MSGWYLKLCFDKISFLLQSSKATDHIIEVIGQILKFFKFLHHNGLLHIEILYVVYLFLFDVVFHPANCKLPLISR